MTVSLRITIDADSAIRTLRALDFTQREGQRAVGRALDRMAFRVQEDATRNQIIRGGKGPPHPTRLTSRTGSLRRSIRVNRSMISVAPSSRWSSPDGFSYSRASPCTRSCGSPTPR